jgi:hypothetical protein
MMDMISSYRKVGTMRIIQKYAGLRTLVIHRPTRVIDLPSRTFWLPFRHFTGSLSFREKDTQTLISKNDQGEHRRIFGLSLSLEEAIRKRYSSPCLNCDAREFRGGRSLFPWNTGASNVGRLSAMPFCQETLRKK